MLTWLSKNLHMCVQFLWHQNIVYYKCTVHMYLYDQNYNLIRNSYAYVFYSFYDIKKLSIIKGYAIKVS